MPSLSSPRLTKRKVLPLAVVLTALGACSTLDGVQIGGAIPIGGVATVGASKTIGDGSGGSRSRTQSGQPAEDECDDIDRESEDSSASEADEDCG